MKVFITRHLLAGFGAPAQDKEEDESDTDYRVIAQEHKMYGDFINIRYEHYD